ncbi:tripartite tricarboxylate transporter TctB family protein [Jannaschia seohaensis]|uniref:Tripartite tricarboxylate transporter TctB family protein n=1 Tax=Jannaschia seohaensis TaxID=475081 RepID=A0A2Y9A654_9RHOB|nr:tripartite tricarboxylate transporter TctB family protein [Jannaschia seohaensis]PWJ21801.1 tripartite tricarboxylate transporter TctB family protein [Jannaschia seohaensis]SSA38079.1 Tripartite tricarboxylate transporter TctB family protein [Jannaschia seohaensis]
MTLRTLQTRLGFAAIAIAALLALVAIPNFVSSPSNVRNIVLSPTFWPYALTGMTALAGLLLLVTGFREEGETPLEEEHPEAEGAWIRIGGLAAIMVAVMLLLPWLGMPLTCMAAFAATAFLFRTRHPVVAVICAVLVPLVLYVFFAKVAGVAVPQGELIRLP